MGYGRRRSGSIRSGDERAPRPRSARTHRALHRARGTRGSGSPSCRTPTTASRSRAPPAGRGSRSRSWPLSLTHLRRNYELTFDSRRIESHDGVRLTTGEQGAYRRAIADVTDLRNLSQPERMQHVLRMLETRDSLPVSELSETFAVSEVTVRSDLTALARQGLVARVRGGVRALQQGQSEVGFDLRLRLEVERKRAIAKRAATMIGEAEAVAIDASTTGYYLALELRARRELVVVT